MTFTRASSDDHRKDNRPDWRPGPDEPLPAEAIDAYFAPLGADELTFARQPP